MIKDKKNEIRDLAICVGFILFLYWIYQVYWLLILGISFLIIGLITPVIRRYNHLFWDKLTKLLQFVFQPILGFLIFAFILTPIGILSQLFRKKKENLNSTFFDVDSKIDPNFFKKQW